MPSNLPAQQVASAQIIALETTGQFSDDLMNAAARVDLERVSLEEALTALSQRVDLDIIFSPTMLPDVRVTCRCQETAFGTAMKRVLPGWGMQEASSGTFVTRRGSQSRGFELRGTDDDALSAASLESVARWGEPDGLLLSGSALGAEDYLAGRPAMLRIQDGHGDLVLFGLRPGFRGQPRNTFKLLFNSIAAGSGAERPA